MVNDLPQRVLLVSYGPKPPLAEAMAAGFGSLGIKTKIFHSWLCNTLYDRFIIHPVNHYARVLRLVPKNTNLFEGHPKSHKEWRSQELLRLALDFKPELIVITGIQRFKAAVLEKLHRLTTVFYWFSESEDRFPEIKNELQFYHYSYFFSSAALAQAQELGFKNLGFLQPGVDTNRFRPLLQKQIYDWCFVGQWHERRQQYVEGLAAVSKNFVIYGSRWRKHNWHNPRILFRIKGTGIWGDEVVKLYNQTRVVVNISVWSDESKGGAGANTRLLEVPACQVCLLSDFNRDAELLMTPGKEFVSAQNLPEMQQKLAELLANAEQRRQIAQNGYNRAIAGRTYNDLAVQLCTDWEAQRTGDR